MCFNKTPGIDVYIYKTIEAISKKSFGPISVLSPRFNPSEYLEYVCGLNLGHALILNQNLIFEMASNKNHGDL